MSTVAMPPMYRWDSIPWKNLHRSVWKLQKRIYRASLDGDRKKVRKLQRLLMSSRAAKLLAVRKVTQDNALPESMGLSLCLNPRESAWPITCLSPAPPNLSVAFGLIKRIRMKKDHWVYQSWRIAHAKRWSNKRSNPNGKLASNPTVSASVPAVPATTPSKQSSPLSRKKLNMCLMPISLNAWMRLHNAPRFMNGYQREKDECLRL